MKLCIVANGDFFSDYGGGQVYVRNLVDELIRQKSSHGIELSIISFAPSFPHLTNHKSYKGVDLYELNPSGNVHDLLLSIHPDIVHAHGEKFLIVKACHELGIKCVVTAHHGGICCPAGTLLNTEDQICHIPAELKKCLPCYLKNIRTGRYWYPVVKLLPPKLYLKIGLILKKLPFVPFLSPIGEALLSIQNKLDQWNTIKDLSNQIIAPSYAIADSLILNGCDKNKISVIPHGIPLPQKKETETKHSEVDTQIPVTFFYVGRICHIKGIHIMLEAFSSIKNRNVELHIIGGAGNKTEKRYQTRLQRQYASDNRISWHGKLESSEVSNLISNYQCLIHPAIYLEVFGLNIAEALAQCKYVIATRCGGAEMQIHDDKSGNLIDPNSVKALIDAILIYDDNPIPSNAQVQSIEEHIRRLVLIYHQVVSEKKTSC